MSEESMTTQARTAAEPGRVLAFVYGVASYAAFFAVFVYLILFVADLWVPKVVDSGVRCSMAIAVAFDVALIALFGLQHSVMARPAFKRAWTRIVTACSFVVARLEGDVGGLDWKLVPLAQPLDQPLPFAREALCRIPGP